MIPIVKRILIAVLISVAGILAATAETYPSRVIRIVVPNIAGAPGDVVARARPLAYTGATRAPLLPDVPTMTESGLPQVGFNPEVWLGPLAPAGTPPAIVECLNAAVNDSLKSPELLASYAKLGFEPKSTTPQEFEAFLVHELGKWPALLRAAGVKPE